MIRTLLILLLALNCQASLVVLWTTNSSTMQLDTNDVYFTPLHNAQNADGSWNTAGLPVRLHNPFGYLTNYCIQNNYLVSNTVTGFWEILRVPDSSSNIVTAGQISLGANSNPFVTVVVPTNQIPNGVLTNTQNGVTLGGTFSGSVTATNGNVVTNGQPSVSFSTNVQVYQLSPITVSGATAPNDFLNSTNWQLVRGTGAGNSLYAKFPDKTNWLYYDNVSNNAYTFSGSNAAPNGQVFEIDQTGASTFDQMVQLTMSASEWTPDALSIHYGATNSQPFTNFSATISGNYQQAVDGSIIGLGSGGTIIPYYSFLTPRGSNLVQVTQDSTYGAGAQCGRVDMFGQSIGIPNTVYNVFRLNGIDLNVAINDKRIVGVWGKASDPTGTNGGNLYLISAGNPVGPNPTFNYGFYLDHNCNIAIGHNSANIDSSSVYSSPAIVYIAGLTTGSALGVPDTTNYPSLEFGINAPYTGTSNGVVNYDGTNLTVIATNVVFKTKNSLSSTASIQSGVFTGNGSSLTNLNGANLQAGSVADAALASTFLKTVTIPPTATNNFGAPAGATVGWVFVITNTATGQGTWTNSFSATLSLTNVNNTISGNGSALTSLNLTNIPNFWNGLTLAGASIQTNGGIGSASGVTLYLTNYSRFSNCATIYFQYTGGSLGTVTNLFTVTNAAWPTFVYGQFFPYNTNCILVASAFKNTAVPVNNGLGFNSGVALTVNLVYLFQLILPLQ